MTIIQPKNREDLVQRLALMELELWCFERALAAGSAEAASYSAGAPSGAPEYGRWARSTEELHNGVMGMRRNWKRTDPMNQPTWISEEKYRALVVSSGDEFTGVNYGNPSNRNPKGTSFGALVSANGQGTFFDAVSESGQLVNIKETWVFLYHAREGFVYSEISLPVAMPGTYIETWQDRIILPRFDGGTNHFEAAIDDGPAQDFEFKIQRR